MSIKGYELICSVLITLLVANGLLVNPVLVAERPIYVVHSWQDYLRLVPVSVHRSYVPLLYTPEPDLTSAILHFAELYGGSPLAVEAEDVQQIVEEKWPQAATVVVAQEHPRFGLIAAAIAAELQSPLFFEPPSAVTLGQLQVQQMIIVGEVVVPSEVDVDMIELPEIEDAQHYYNGQVGERPVAILAEDGTMGFLAAEVVAFHRGNLLLTPQEIPKHRPRYLAWVTGPQSLTKHSVYELYELCRFTADSQIYDAGVGILTGLTPHDLSLLLARTYAYPQFEGEWKERVLSAGLKSNPAEQSTYGQPLEAVSLVGHELTREAFGEAIQDFGYVGIEVHGSPSGFALVDGLWPGRPEIAELPPQVFVAESCLTGDIGGVGIENSVALRLVAAGAVAYIGSLEVGGVALVGSYPFAFSTPSMPLGTLVRLQNAARMDVDADAPRAILIGDPKFYQFDQERVSYEVLPEFDRTTVNIQRLEGRGPVVVALEIPEEMRVKYARAYLSGQRGSTYMPGMTYHDRPLGRILSLDGPLSSDLAFEQTAILLEWPGGDGQLTLHARPPWAALLRRLLVHSLIGVQAIFIDLFSVPGVGVPLAVISLIILIAIWFSRRRVLRTDALWGALLVGVGMSLGGVLYCLGLRFRIPWPIVVVAGSWATTVIWLVVPHSYEWKHIAPAVGFYIAPLILVLMLVFSVGASQQILIRIGYGIILTALVYGFFVSAAMLISRKVIG